MSEPVIHVDPSAVLSWGNLHFALEAAGKAAVDGVRVTAGALLHGMTLEELRQLGTDLMATAQDEHLRKQLSLLVLLVLDQEDQPIAFGADTGVYLRRLLALVMAEAHERQTGNELNPDTLLLHDIDGVPQPLA